MCKRITAWLLILCFAMSAVPVSAGAAAEPAVFAEAVTVTAANTAYLTLRAENFGEVASFEVSVYYDPSVFTVTGSYDGYLLSGAQTSVNTEVSGEVKLVAMKLDGISGDGDLLTLQLQTFASCTPGTYPITIAVGNAYDTAFEPVSIHSRSSSVKIEEAVETEAFYIDGHFDKWTVQKGETLSYQLTNWSYQPFVSGDFLITYDHELFAFESAQLNDQLLGSDVLHSVNSSAMGQVRITYARTAPVQSAYLLTVKLKAIADTDASTEIKAQASNMYRENLSAYLPGSTSQTVTLQKLPEVTDYPNAFLKTERLVVGEQSQAVFCLEKGANVAAGDFTLTYDPAHLRCVKVETAETVESQGGMVVVNDNYTSGEIHFSYVNMDAYDETDVALVKITWEPLQSPSAHYRVTVSSEGVVNESAIVLEHVTDTGCIFSKIFTDATCQSPGLVQYHCSGCGNRETSESGELAPHQYQATVTNPTCTEAGYTTHTCTECGNTYTDSETSALGHEWGEWDISAATCTADGSKTRGCKRCGHTETEAIGALGHDLTTRTTDAACTVDGSRVTTCSRCDYTQTEVIPATGHSHVPAVTAPTCTEVGYTTYTCHCGDSYVADEVPAKGHTCTYAVSAAPTADAEGAISGSCTACGETLTQTLPKLNKTDYTLEVLVEPTKESEGFGRYTWNVTKFGEFTFEATISNVLLGDVNDDGKVTVSDLMRLANHFAKGVEINEANSDVNCDGKVTVSDLMRLANYFAGKAQLG